MNTRGLIGFVLCVPAGFIYGSVLGALNIPTSGFTFLGGVVLGTVIMLTALYLPLPVKPKPRHWQEWDKPMIVDRYSWITKVDTRPLDERDFGDEDSPQQ